MNISDTGTQQRVVKQQRVVTQQTQQRMVTQQRVAENKTITKKMRTPARTQKTRASRSNNIQRQRLERIRCVSRLTMSHAIRAVSFDRRGERLAIGTYLVLVFECAFEHRRHSKIQVQTDVS